MLSLLFEQRTRLPVSFVFSRSIILFLPQLCKMPDNLRTSHTMEGEEQNTPQSPCKSEDSNSGLEADASNKETITRQRNISESEIQAKRQRTEACDVPGSSSKPAPAIAPSPPQFMSLAEVMKAADGLKNMVLAHEIALDSEFELQPPTTAEGSMYARVQEMMHKAFWDLLSSELSEDPPSYNQAMTLLREIKETLLEMVPPRAVSLRNDIEQKLDIDLIQQQAEAGTLDFQNYAQYVIHTMGRMCCPVRDDDVAALKEINDVVPTFKGILEVLKKMKLDYANFTIREARPMIVANSIIYEKKKFTEFLTTQKDGLQATREWLLRHKEQVLEADKVSGESHSPNQLTSTILANAYIEALEWPANQTLPETLVLDHERIKKLHTRIQELVVLATVVLVSMPVVGQSVRDLAAFKEHIKETIKLLLKDVDIKNSLVEVMPNIAAQVQLEVEQVLKKHSLPALTEEAQNILKGQIEAVAQPDNRIRQLAKSRLMAFMHDVASSTAKNTLQVPVGFSALKSELGSLAGDFNNLIWYNKSVFSEWYATILDLHPNLTQTSSAVNNTTEVK